MISRGFQFLFSRCVKHLPWLWLRWSMCLSIQLEWVRETERPGACQLQAMQTLQENRELNLQTNMKPYSAFECKLIQPKRGCIFLAFFICTGIRPTYLSNVIWKHESFQLRWQDSMRSFIDGPFLPKLNVCNVHMGFGKHAANKVGVYLVFQPH